MVRGASLFLPKYPHQDEDTDAGDGDGDGTAKDRVQRLQDYYSRRQTLDLVIIIFLVTVSSLWWSAISRFCEQRIFKSQNPSWVQWALIAMIATVVFFMVMHVLKAPIFLFA